MIAVINIAINMRIRNNTDNMIAPVPLTLILYPGPQYLISLFNMPLIGQTAIAIKIMTIMVFIDKVISILSGYIWSFISFWMGDKELMIIEN